MKNAQDSKNSLMNWRITSKIIDVAEISPNDTQNIYLVYVNDGINNIEAREVMNWIQTTTYGDIRINWYYTKTTSS